jgi:hypothetical protein
MSGTDANPSVQSAASVTLGLREDWQQFSLLVLINAFVGGMVGLERPSEHRPSFRCKERSRT